MLSIFVVSSGSLVSPDAAHLKMSRIIRRNRSCSTSDSAYSYTRGLSVCLSSVTFMHSA